MPRLSIPMRAALSDPSFFGEQLVGESWVAWRVLLIAIAGEPLEPDELVVFQGLAGRERAPSEPVREFWAVVGRRGGKSRAAAVLAAWLAGCRDHRSALAPRERAQLIVLAQTKDQAANSFNFICGVFAESKALRGLILNRGADTLSLRSGIDIVVKPASYRSVRGPTCIGCICDEIAFWHDQDNSSNPAKEILRALRPSLLTTNGPLVAISSPYSRQGPLYENYHRHYGKDDSQILVVQAGTLVMHPGVSQKFIDEQFADDPVAADAEYNANFRSDLESYVSPETVAACTDAGIVLRAYKSGIHYIAHCDPSGGRQDSFTVAIGHVENGIGILDILLERRPPFSPTDTVSEFCETLKSYSIVSIEGDRYGAEFVQEQFRLNGIRYIESEKTTSDYFAGFLPILTSGRTRLLDSKRLASQLCSLERRTSRVGGKDSIGHPPGGHDDLCASVAGLMVRLAGKRQLIITDAILQWSGQPAAPVMQRQPHTIERGF